MELTINNVLEWHEIFNKLYTDGIRRETINVNVLLHFCETIESLQTENEQLLMEIDHYKQEAQKIPSVCRWWQDILQDIPEGEPCTRMLMDMCPQICPKYRKGVGE
jgi:hypothetical protein